MSSKLLVHLRRKYLKNPLGDLTGGLMAAVVALPLCLAFGVASGLGAAAGLYGAVACGIIAAIFGGTPAQCSGPTGPMTVVAASICASYPQRPELVFAAVVLSGLIQIAMGFGKAGQLIGYMPYPVISGFMTGIGAIIICIQLAPLFGLSSTGNVIAALESLQKLPVEANRDSIVISAISFAIIYLLPFVAKRLPASLVALVVATFVSTHYNMELPRIGNIPSEIPTPKLPLVDVLEFHFVLQSALTLAFLGAIDSLLTSVVLDKVSGRRHNSDQELIGQGLGNMVAGLVGGLPGAGATMRSMVNVRSGGTTALSGALHGVILLAVLLFLGQIAAQVPLAALAAILFSVGLNILDWRVLKNIANTPKSDAFVMLVVLFLTIFVDLIVAVLVGVALASVLFVKQLSDARVSTLDKLDNMEELRELTEHLPQSLRKRTFSYLLNGPLFFGEAKNLTAQIDHILDAKYVILRFANVPLIDQTGAFALETAIERWQQRGIEVLFVGLKPHVRKVLESNGVTVSESNHFETFEEAIDSIGAAHSANLNRGVE